MTANRLASETSPYLLQHAHNPVDWYPWGDEAFAKAKREDKPIFLSVGYSACHWCHVMERESFENEQVAAILNEHYVNIKVDREERPDVDAVYMNAVMAVSGSGGWPMSVFLMPSGEPFFAGTYFPPQDWGNRIGFPNLITRIAAAWNEDRTDLRGHADEITHAVRQMCTPQTSGEEVTTDDITAAVRALLRSVDRVEGGFGNAPKFPHPMDLRLLLRQADRLGANDPQHTEVTSAVKLTLDKMAAGGIYDHLGGGFHRYSTDRRWLAPHFEKMLYDNALLAVVYTEAAQFFDDDRYRNVVRETLDYVLAEMTHPEGGFYATQDADSEGEEGRFFVWQEHEIDVLLEPEAARVFKAVYDVTPNGNWEGKTILNRTDSDGRSPAEFGFTADAEGKRLLEESLATSRARLLDARKLRVAPGTDEKVLAAWNGLMITAFARAGVVLDEERYLEAARNACRYLQTHLVDESGRLGHSIKDGQVSGPGFLDDYAAVIDGLLELFQATGEPEWFTEAERLTVYMLDAFSDSAAAGFWYSSSDHDELITQRKDVQDSATPSGNALAVTALVKLAALTGSNAYRQTAAETLAVLAGTFRRFPTAGGQALIAADLLLGPSEESVLIDAADSDNEVEAELWKQLHQKFRPRTLLLRKHAGSGEWPESLAGLITARDATDEPRLFVCHGQACDAPIVGADAIREHATSE